MPGPGTTSSQFTAVVMSAQGTMTVAAVGPVGVVGPVGCGSEWREQLASSTTATGKSWRVNGVSRRREAVFMDKVWGKEVDGCAEKLRTLRHLVCLQALFRPLITQSSLAHSP